MIRLCRNKVERTKNAARVRKIKKLNYKAVQLWIKADLWRQVPFAVCESLGNRVEEQSILAVVLAI